MRLLTVTSLVLALLLCFPPGASAETRRKQPTRSDSETEDNFKRFSVDIGGATGSSGGVSFFEIHAALSYYIYRWLIWRNSPFYRFASGTIKDEFGLDTSLRLQHAFTGGDVVPWLFAGPGFRFTSSGRQAPFVEAGLGLRGGGLHVAASVQYLFNDVITKGAPNVLIYGVAFAASGNF